MSAAWLTTFEVALSWAQGIQLETFHLEPKPSIFLSLVSKMRYLQGWFTNNFLRTPLTFITPRTLNITTPSHTSD